MNKKKTYVAPSLLCIHLNASTPLLSSNSTSGIDYSGGDISINPEGIIDKTEGEGEDPWEDGV